MVIAKHQLVGLPSAKPKKPTQDQQKQGNEKNAVGDKPDFQKRICRAFVYTSGILDASVFIRRFTFFLKA